MNATSQLYNLIKQRKVKNDDKKLNLIQNKSPRQSNSQFNYFRVGQFRNVTAKKSSCNQITGVDIVGFWKNDTRSGFWRVHEIERDADGKYKIFNFTSKLHHKRPNSAISKLQNDKRQLNI